MSFLSLELKFGREFYNEEQLYQQILDEILDIQSRLSALSWGGGVQNVYFEGYDITQTDEPNAILATFQLRVIHDEPET